jgi:hypothetical protein
MSNADAQKYFAKCEELAEKLEAAHVLRNPHDTDVVYFLAEGETVAVYWEAGGEPPQKRRSFAKHRARLYYKKLLADGFVAPAPLAVEIKQAA